MSLRDTPLLNILSWCRNVTLRSSFYPGTETWHPIHILSWCRNVTLRSSFYPGIGTWHPIHILSWCRNVAPDPLISFYQFIKPSFLPRHHQSHYFSSSSLLLCQGIINLITLVHQAFFYTKASSLTKTLGFLQDLGFNNFIMLI